MAGGVPLAPCQYMYENLLVLKQVIFIIVGAFAHINQVSPSHKGT